MSTTTVICICVSIILAGILASPKTDEIDYRLKKEIGDRLDDRLKEIGNQLKEIGDRLYGISRNWDEFRKLQDRETEE